MKIIRAILILALVFSASCKNSRNDNFYERALGEAEKNQKLIILDFGAKWCGGCRAYDKYVFKDSSIVAKLAEKFILIKIDEDNPENFFLVKKYRISGIPHIVIIDEKERILGSLNSFYIEFIEKPNIFIKKLEGIINEQEKIKKLEAVFNADTTNLEAINNLLAAYQSVDQYIEIQHLNNMLIQLYPTTERMFEFNLSKAIHSLREDWDPEPMMAFLRANTELDNDHKYDVYQQLLFFYRDIEDIQNQDVYYLKLFKMDPGYYKREYADFLFENKLKIDTAILLANEFCSIEDYKNFFWTYYLNAHVMAYSGKKDKAIQIYSEWMEKKKNLFIKEDEYWAFYFYAKFANIHNLDLERALEYIKIAEEESNMIDGKILMAEILFKLGRVNESILKLNESLAFTNDKHEYNRITKIIEKYSKG